MGRSHSTLSRELRRNQGGRGYRHKQADRLAFQRHRNKAKAKKLTPETQDYIQEKIRLRWSPEQVCGRLLNERNLSLSPETLYLPSQRSTAWWRPVELPSAPKQTLS